MYVPHLPGSTLCWKLQGGGGCNQESCSTESGGDAQPEPGLGMDRR